MDVKEQKVSVRRIMKQHRIPLSDAQRNYLRQKRVFDVVIAAMALVVLAVPFAVVALLQKLSSPTEPRAPRPNTRPPASCRTPTPISPSWGAFCEIPALMSCRSCSMF